jgi:hypothetical protein
MLCIAGLVAQAQSASGGWATGRTFSVGVSQPLSLHLFLEATQRKTVRTVAAVVWVDLRAGMEV